MAAKDFSKQLLDEFKRSIFHDFAFAKENLIHTLQRAGYLRIRRGTLAAGIDPLTTETTSFPVPTGRVWVAYDFQVDTNLPFYLYVRVYFDNNLWALHLGMPSTWYWKILGWDPFFNAISLTFLNQSAVDILYFSLIGRFLEFTAKQWNQFKENFLHPLEYYAKTVMEQEL